MANPDYKVWYNKYNKCFKMINNMFKKCAKKNI